MDIYVRNRNFVTQDVVDTYESLVWAERFQEIGDFTLTILSNRTNRAIFRTGQYITIPKSHVVMEIEYVKNSTDDEGRRVLEITGRDLMYILKTRTAMELVPLTPDTTDWVITNKPILVAMTLLEQTVLFGYMSTQDILPLKFDNVLYPPDTLPQPQDTVTYAFEPQPLYDAMQLVAKAHNFGMRMYYREGFGKELRFNFYTGVDRTSAQDLTEAIIFSPDLENLANTNEIESIQDYYNVCYVRGPEYTEYVFSSDVTLDISGLDRRVMQIVVDKYPEEYTGTSAEIQAKKRKYLQSKGIEALANQKKFIAFDGEIPQQMDLEYGVHYNLGDMVEMRNDDGITKIVRIVENIISVDNNGFKSYPTLQDVLLITPGSWLDWEYNVFWENALGTWSEQ